MSLDATPSTCIMAPPLWSSLVCSSLTTDISCHAPNFLDLAMTLTFVFSPQKPFRQRPLTWWIFIGNFIEIPPLIKEISRHVMWMNGRTTGGRATENMLPLPPASCGGIKQFSQKNKVLNSNWRTLWFEHKIPVACRTQNNYRLCCNEKQHQPKCRLLITTNSCDM